MNANAIKRKIAHVFDAVGVNSLGHFIQRQTLFPFIRVVNYHIITPAQAENFSAQLKYYSSRFVNVDEQMLAGFLRTGDWPHTKPGLILSFDDGTRDHFEVAAPLLEKYGFTGWFFVPSGWVAEQNGVKTEKPEFVGDNEPLTHEQLRYLDKNHVVGCHTKTHCRLSADLSPEALHSETLEAKIELEELLGHPVNIFCWVGGEEYTYTRPAADLVRQGYELGFMTNSAVVRPGTSRLQLQRTNIEAENPLSLVRFQLSGFMDLAYYGKRKRVNKLTS